MQTKMQCSVTPDSSNSVYNNMILLLNEHKCVHAITDYLQENNIFKEEYYIGEPFDGTIFSIPLDEWNAKTGMNIVIDRNGYYHDNVPILSDLLDIYSGTICISTEIDDKNVKHHFIIICGDA